MHINAIAQTSNPDIQSDGDADECQSDSDECHYLGLPGPQRMGISLELAFIPPTFIFKNKK